MKKKIIFLGILVFALLFLGFSFFYYSRLYAFISFPRIENTLLFSLNDLQNIHAPKNTCFQYDLDFTFDDDSRKDCLYNGNIDSIEIDDFRGWGKKVYFRENEVVSISSRDLDERQITVKKENDLIEKINYRELFDDSLYTNLTVFYEYQNKKIKQIVFVDSLLDKSLNDSFVFRELNFIEKDSMFIEKTLNTYAEFFPSNEIQIPWKVPNSKDAYDNIKPVQYYRTWINNPTIEEPVDCDELINCNKSSRNYVIDKKADKIIYSNSKEIISKHIKKNRNSIEEFAELKNEKYKKNVLIQKNKSGIIKSVNEDILFGLWGYKRFIEVLYDSVSHLPEQRTYQISLVFLNSIEFQLKEVKERLYYDSLEIIKKEKYVNDSLIETITIDRDIYHNPITIKVSNSLDSIVNKTSIQYWYTE